MRRKILFYFIMFCLVLFVLEAGSFILVRSRVGSRVGVVGLRDKLLGRLSEPAWKRDNPLRSIVPHPYFGFAEDPEQGRIAGAEGKAFVNDHGMFGGDILASHSARDYNVLVLGGSVAGNFFNFCGETLQGELSGLEWLKDRKVNVFCGAVAAYKAPQQLMVLAYFLSLGAKIDMVVNIDGFNEAAVSAVHNRDVSLFYPGLWGRISKTYTDKRELVLIGRLCLIEELQARLGRFFTSVQFMRSHTLEAGWLLGDGLLERSRGEVLLQVMSIRDKPRAYRRGYDFKVAEKDLPRTLALSWARTSKLMADLAWSRSITYVHVLQPNQYVPDCKPFSEQELEKAFSPHSPYAEWAVKGYAEMRPLGRELAAKGVLFLDATMVFRDVKDTLYIDDCCHFNKQGGDILASFIVERLKEPGPDRAGPGLYSNSTADFTDPSLFPAKGRGRAAP